MVAGSGVSLGSHPLSSLFLFFFCYFDQSPPVIGPTLTCYLLIFHVSLCWARFDKGGRVFGADRC